IDVFSLLWKKNSTESITLERERESRSTLGPADGRRVSERAVAGALCHSPRCSSSASTGLPSPTALSELWLSPQSSSSSREVPTVMVDNRLESVAAGPSLREVGASAAQSSPALFPGGEGFHSLALPALGFLS
ncbi:hypothetical protein IGI04_034848, partial [Brassica rapa subsp. trilocularis]